MATSTTSNVYIQVIEDVVNKVRDEFISNAGPGESVLKELQGLWELKMMQAGGIIGPIERSSAQKSGGLNAPVHDLNVPYEGTEEYETPTADMLFPPTPLQTPMPTPLPGMAQTPLPGSAEALIPGTAQTPLSGTPENSFYNIPTGGTPITPSEFSSLNGSNSAPPEVKPAHGRPVSFMQPPSPWLSQRPPLDVNVAYVEGREDGDRGMPHPQMTQEFFMTSTGKRKRDGLASNYPNSGFIPQQDGAGDCTAEKWKLGFPHGERGIDQLDGPYDDLSPTPNLGFPHGERGIDQLDGPYDDLSPTPNVYNYQGVVNEDYNIVNAPAPNGVHAATPAPVPLNDPVDDEEDEPLNEDDDDELDYVDQEEDLNTTHLVLAQFDKVTRAKNRWKCILKDGIMHINNKDILFNKATGEFEF